ncbi:MAG: hypothetical protein ACRD1G_12765, partial [Acidimicrobiales bacterium]
AMGTTLCADREHPGTFVRIVQFPSYEAAMANSEHPATARFAKEFEALCEGDLTFRNLDTVSTETF